VYAGGVTVWVRAPTKFVELPISPKVRPDAV
jgi:hypothetical protein